MSLEFEVNSGLIVSTLEQGPIYADNLEQAISLLNPSNSFVFFDLELTEEEKDMLDNLTVSHTYESLEAEYSKNMVNKFFQTIGNSPKISSLTSSLLDRILSPILSSNPEDTGFSLTSTQQEQASPMFFHIDEPIEFENIHFRISIALKGSGTLFCKLVEDENKKAEAYQTVFNEMDFLIKNRENYDVIINQINNIFNPCNLSAGNSIVQAPKYFGAAFIYGKSNYSAIHSTPKTDEENRIFLFAEGTK